MNIDQLHKEISFKTSRSGGAGGQHVNKVSTKVELLFDVAVSKVLSQNQISIVLEKLKSRIDSNGTLHLQCDESRSQQKNKEIAFKRLVEMLKEALKPVKKRKLSKPSKASKRKRLDEKKKHSLKKESRRFNPKKD